MEVTRNGSYDFGKYVCFNSFVVTAAAVFRLFGHKTNPLLKVIRQGPTDWVFCFASESRRVIYYHTGRIAVWGNNYIAEFAFDYDVAFDLKRCFLMISQLFNTDWLDDIVWSRPTPMKKFTLPSMSRDTALCFESIALLFDMLRRKLKIECESPSWCNEAFNCCGIRFKNISTTIDYTRNGSVNCGGHDIFTVAQIKHGVTLANWLNKLHEFRASLEHVSVFDADPTEFVEIMPEQPLSGCHPMVIAPLSSKSDVITTEVVEVVTAIPVSESKPATSPDMATQPKDALSPVPNGKLLMQAELQLEEERIAKMRLEDSKKKQLDDVLFDALLTAALWEKKQAVSYQRESFKIPMTTNRSVADRLVCHFGGTLNHSWRRDLGNYVYFEVPLPQSK